jgi:hypothetical protein
MQSLNIGQEVISWVYLGFKVEINEIRDRDRIVAPLYVEKCYEQGSFLVFTHCITSSGLLIILQ